MAHMYFLCERKWEELVSCKVTVSVIIWKLESCLIKFRLFLVCHLLDQGSSVLALLTFWPEKSLLWVAVLLIAGCLAASLTSVHSMLVEPPPPPTHCDKHVSVYCQTCHGGRIAPSWEVQHYILKILFQMFQSMRKRYDEMENFKVNMN